MLMRTDPFRELDRLTEAVMGSPSRPVSLPMDAFRDQGAFVVQIEVPGVDPGSIDLSVEGNTLTISAERSVPQIEGAEWSVAERPFGNYTRQLVLGRSLDTDRLEAHYHDGVLTLSIPVAEKARARKISVTRADTPTAVEGRTIEGESTERRSVES